MKLIQILRGFGDCDLHLNICTLMPFLVMKTAFERQQITSFPPNARRYFPVLWSIHRGITKSGSQFSFFLSEGCFSHLFPLGFVVGHLWQQEVTNTRSEWPMTPAASRTSPPPASPRRLEDRHDPFQLKYPQARHKDLTLWDDGPAVYSGAPAAVMNIGREWRTATLWGLLWFWCRSNAIADCGFPRWACSS